MTDRLHIATYNIHKGFSFFKRRMVILELRAHLRTLDADLVFLQEVQGGHTRHAHRFENWPEQPQHEFLADSIWTDFAYGRNSVYHTGPQGDTALTFFPISSRDNENISQ